MPSPIAHSAVALVLWPALKKSARRGIRSESERFAVDAGAQRQWRIRTWVLLGGVLVMLNAPDLDMVPHLLFGGETWLAHGGPTHSIFAGAVAACAFASFFYLLLGIEWIRLWVIGALAWWSHILLDFFTLHGGVAAFWPITTERFASPVPLFFGVRHSQPGAWHLHFITIVTELVFVAVLWFVHCRFINGRVKMARCAEARDSVENEAASGSADQQRELKYEGVA